MHIFYTLLIFALLGTFCVAEENSNDLEVERVKRVAVAVEDVDFASSNDERPAQPRKGSLRTRQNDAAVIPNSFAIVLPPYHDSSAAFDKTKHSCLLYLEGITILVLDKSSLGGVQRAYALPLFAANDSYAYDEKYVDCKSNFTNGTPFSFTIDYQITQARELRLNDAVVMSVSKGFTLKLNFISNTGIDLKSAVLDGLTINKGSGWLTDDVTISSASATSLDGSSFRAYYGYNYACSSTPALLFQKNDTTSKVIVGIILNNFQVQGNGIDVDDGSKIPYFGSRTTDCIPTFNQGTWMGIIVTLILVSVLAFAFLMLNSVQTMDRFDDPKQKQIVINFKE